MQILVIDGQGGGLGRQIVAALKEADPMVSVHAVGLNSIATAAMLKAGADTAATGENAVLVGSRKADAIAGPMGIVIADAMMGEVTPAIAVAVGQSGAKRILLPMNQCDTVVVGVLEQSVGQSVQGAVRAVLQLRDTPR